MGARRWTSDEDKWLRWWWGSATIAKIAERLNRTPNGIYQRARKLSLGLGKPNGYATLDDLSQRSGYHRHYLVTIFKHHGVSLRRCQWSDPSQLRGRRYHRIIVEEEAAMEAIQAWSSMETLHAAARRLGLVDSTLRSALVELGHTPPARKGFWHLPASTFDEAAPLAQARSRGPRAKPI